MEQTMQMMMCSVSHRVFFFSTATEKIQILFLFFFSHHFVLLLLLFFVVADIDRSEGTRTERKEKEIEFHMLKVRLAVG
jgi:hypothetical protein